MITCITPTGDRHRALRVCAEWLRRQVYQGDVQWIVVDDGEKPYCPPPPGKAWAVDHIVRKSSGIPGVDSFTGNLMAALPLVQGEKIFIIEDDDYYVGSHLLVNEQLLDRRMAVGDSFQRYYHLQAKRWVVMRNRGAALCQTAFRRELLPSFREAVHAARLKGMRGVDALFWRHVMGKGSKAAYYLSKSKDVYTVIGLKGYPGRHGLGIGHNPSGRHDWHDDPKGEMLRRWLQSDIQVLRDQGVNYGA